MSEDTQPGRPPASGEERSIAAQPGRPPASGEERSIAATRAPVTRARIADDLRALGVRPGSVTLVHSSVSALGWVCGGAQAVVEALRDALGPDGTLVVPTHTGGNSDPADWQRPPVPEAWWPVIRAEMPAFDPALTPVRGLGAVVELVRALPGALRSAHPQVSFAAIGPQAAAVTEDHALDSGFGERSPVGRIHELDGDVLLLGAGHGANSSLHLAEYRVPVPQRETSSAAVAGPDGRRWVTWEDVVADESDFEELGAAFDATGSVSIGPVGEGEARLMRQRELVEFAVAWMTEHRAP
jgi:aminoglycoside 3-N-acetyltransferase